jgi:hypothetical protein
MSTLEELARMWIEARGPEGCRCVGCERSHVALLVTEQQMYRWTCVACGRRSDWFVIERGEVRIIGRRNTMSLPSHAVTP